MDPLSLLIYIVIVAIVIGIIVMLYDMAPFNGPFKPWGRWAIIAIGVLLILRRALPLLGI